MNKIILISIALILVLFALWRFNTQSQHYAIDVPLPENFPKNSFIHQQFEQLLKRFVSSDGTIQYQQWFDEPNAHYQLKQYLAAVAKFSPENAHPRFASDQDELAYWIYSYNAIVIHLILSNWPLESVTDIKAPIELVKGLGFFYNQKFVVGGKSYNLYELEQQKMIKANADPRLHFVLNCGSKSCPPMRPSLPVGAQLSPFLEQATHDFINDINNVKFDQQTGKIKLSMIFKWYIDDFSQYALNHLYQGNSPISQEQSLLIFIDFYRNEKLLPATTKIDVYFMSYQWDINKSGTQQ